MVCSRYSLSMAEICSLGEFKELLVLLLYRERLPVRPPCRTVARLKKSTATTTYRWVEKRPRLPRCWSFLSTKPASQSCRICRSTVLRHSPRILAMRLIDGHARPVRELQWSRRHKYVGSTCRPTPAAGS